MVICHIKGSFKWSSPLVCLLLNHSVYLELLRHVSSTKEHKRTCRPFWLLPGYSFYQCLLSHTLLPRQDSA